MVRKRLLTLLAFQDGVLFRTKLFHPDYRYTLNFVDSWSVDEIILLDITRPGCGDKNNFYQVVRDFSKKCFVPLSVGGGIRSIDDAKALFTNGADKVVLNTGAISSPELIKEISKLYGRQSVVISMDVKTLDNGDKEVFSNFGSVGTGMDPIVWARTAESMGAGEILFLPIERDGWLQGMDIKYASKLVEAVKIPLLIAGGAGNWSHILEAFQSANVDGVCTQNIYHFTETSIKSAKQFLKNSGVHIRC
jgi:cyclase